MARRAYRPITFPAGDAYFHQVPFWSDLDQTVPLDVSARTYTAQVRQSTLDEDPLETFVVDATSAAAGLIVVHLVASQTRALFGVRCYWDFQQVIAGQPVTLFGGPVVAQGDYTQ